MAEHSKTEEDWDELISRFLDGEIEPASLAELESNPRFAAALQRAVRVQQELRALPAATDDPGPGLTARIMDRLPSPAHVRGGWLRRPLALPAWSVALAALLLLAAGAWLVAGRPAGPAPGQAVRAPQPQACPQPRVLVRFVLRAPDARTVSLAGDFNGWSVADTPLTDLDGNGVWTVVVPLHTGRYQYKFVVDGERWVVDPDAPAFHPDGFGGRNALLAI